MRFPSGRCFAIEDIRNCIRREIEEEQFSTYKNAGYRRTRMLYRTLPKPAYAFAVFVCKHGAFLPFVHLRQSVCTRRVFTVSLELFKDFIFVESTFQVAVACLIPVLTTIFVDTLRTTVVAAERDFHNVIEPITSQFMLKKFPRLSRISSNLDNIQPNEIQHIVTNETHFRSLSFQKLVISLNSSDAGYFFY